MDNKDARTETPGKARPEDFVLIRAAVDFMDLLGIWDVVESATYMISMRPMVGAPSLARFCSCAKGGIARTLTGRAHAGSQATLIC